MKKKRRKKNRVLKVLSRIGITVLVTLLILIVGLYALMWVVTKGPSKKAGEIFAMSVRETSAIGFLANWFYTDEEIADIERRNAIADTTMITDTSMVSVILPEEGEETDTQMTEPIEIIDVKGTTYNGKLMLVKDPSRLFVGVVPEFGDGNGMNVINLCKRYDAVAGINGGEFVDGAVTSTAMPVGLVISQGKLLNGDLNTTYHVTGFNQENVLVIGNMTGQQALDLGIRDCVNINRSIGPFLIINGEAQDVEGVGGGLNPRTAIGQRADGVVLLLVVDGRQANSLGATFGDLIDIMSEYGAVNASAMDGGTSAQMCYEGEIINKPYSPFGARECPTGFLVGGIAQ
jgi:exopolysaccharide biosynthesis protein